MSLEIAHFNQSDLQWDSVVTNQLFKNINILEIGAGAHPVIKDRSNLIYTIVDPDKSELDKAPNDVNKIHGIVQDMVRDDKYDLIISRMVLEHVENPDSFHESVNALLTEEGVAIHFYACPYSLPSIVNRLLPEKLGAWILSIIGNRPLDNNPKYKAYYRSCYINDRNAEKYFSNLNFDLSNLKVFLGHNYFRIVPVLNQLEEMFSYVLYQLKWSSMASVAILSLQKKK